ncbi:hypothetical protein IJ135_00385, partial [Candidatus Saccharibacteria bacterium]|nr:hypothetical protein [Candidatus Saccharibacteria bacterium]
KATLDAGRVVEVKFDAHGARTTPAANANVDDNSWAGFYKNFMGDDFTDPTGQKYNLYVTNCIKTTSVKPGEACNNNNLSTLNPDNNYDLDYTIYVAIGATCDSNQAVRSLNMRNVAIIYKLERAGLYCYNS